MSPLEMVDQLFSLAVGIYVIYMSKAKRHRYSETMARFDAFAKTRSRRGGRYNLLKSRGRSQGFGLFATPSGFCWSPASS